jgi:hypothetical protein
VNAPSRCSLSRRCAATVPFRSGLCRSHVRTGNLIPSNRSRVRAGSAVPRSCACGREAGSPAQLRFTRRAALSSLRAKRRNPTLCAKKWIASPTSRNDEVDLHLLAEQLQIPLAVATTRAPTVQVPCMNRSDRVCLTTRPSASMNSPGWTAATNCTSSWTVA